MAKNTPPPRCPKCKKPMRFVLVKTGGRKFRCMDCDGEDPLKSPDMAKLLTGGLRPLKIRLRQLATRPLPRHTLHCGG
jgi:hypothetical protein